MQQLDIPNCENLLIGADGFSDASVYRLPDGRLMVQSLDFFPPLVDDPYTFGQIAAANSLSDIFAMGASPVTALNIVAFPDDKLSLDILVEILQGGDSKVRESGAVTAGGHTVRDEEIKYGLSVTGLCESEQLLDNSSAKPGDVLVLTKPLGTGFVTTAMKAQKSSPAAAEAAITSMATLNLAASESARRGRASSVTDVTGFGLAGHAIEMADGSGVTLQIEPSLLPVLPEALSCFQAGYITRASKSNRQANAAKIAGIPSSPTPKIELLFDPQTSGGLLISLPEQSLQNFITEVSSRQAFAPVVIGNVVTRNHHSIELG